jgi:hypothetical protein
MIIKSFELFESTIGSEEIRKKWYPAIDRRLFYQIVNIDPTTIRKENFSKPGKYSKWLLMKMIDSDGKLTESGEYWLKQEKEQLNLALFIFSTGWFKLSKRGLTDILKYDSINTFMSQMEKLIPEYFKSMKAEYDVIYSDENIDIVIPLNFSASWQTAQGTSWCTKNVTSYNIWSSSSILFRILPKSKSYNKVKITWVIPGSTKLMTLTENFAKWTIASEQYPEIRGSTRGPFDEIKGKEAWEYDLDTFIARSYDIVDGELVRLSDNDRKKHIEPFKKLRETMSLLTPEAKKEIERHYQKALNAKK